MEYGKWQLVIQQQTNKHFALVLHVEIIRAKNNCLQLHHFASHARKVYEITLQYLSIFKIKESFNFKHFLAESSTKYI